MSWLTEQYDKAVENNPIAKPFKRKRWDPVGDTDAYLSKVFGGGTSGDLEEQGKITARRLAQQHETSGEDRVRSLYLLALSRSASDEEIRGTLETLARLTAQGVADEEAWGMLCHAVFASNEFLMRF